MRQSPEREGVFVQVVGFAQQVLHEVARADVVNQVAEELAAERIVAHVLQDASGIGIGMRSDAVRPGVAFGYFSRSSGLMVGSHEESMIAS